MSINFPYYTTSTSNQGDLYYNDDTLLLHADGVTGSNNTGTFVDASTNTSVITRTGTPAQGSVNPFGTNWSAYFNGATTGTVYASTVTTSSFAFGTNNWTIEAWINAANTVSNYPLIIGNYVTTFTTNSWGLFYNRIDTGNFYFAANNGGMTLASGSAYIVPGWNHVAVSRNGATVSMFVNGTQTASYNYAATSLDGGVAARLFIGDAGGNDTTTRFNGYISNLRVVNGSAVYTSAFTPSTAPLTTVTNTALLTLSTNRVQDVSTNTFATTSSSGVSIQRFNPFGNTQTYSISSATIQGSTYFDGSSYATISSNPAFAFGTGDFTIEMWVYPQSAVGYQCIFEIAGANPYVYLGINTGSSGTPLLWSDSTIITGSTNFTLNTWQHFCLVRESGTCRMYLNGLLIGSSTVLSGNMITGTVTIGATNGGIQFFSGYISNLRVTKGQALYSITFTPSATPLTTVTNTILLTCQTSQSVADVSTVSNTITTTAGTPYPTLRTPFVRNDTSTAATVYGGSIYFNGSTDYLVLSSSSAFGFGAGNFTIECWVYPITQGGHGSGNNDCLIDFRNNSTAGAYGLLYIPTSGSGVYWNANGSLGIAGSAISNNVWTHLAVSRSGTSTKLFINGTQSGSTFNDTTSYLASPVWIGQFHDGGGAGWFNGYISNLRIVNGQALYTANFTLSTIPLTTSSQGSNNTTLLIPGINAGIYDSNMQNNLVTVGSAQISSTSTSTVKFGAGSVYLNGSSNYLLFPSNTNFNLYGNFTIEFWTYITTTASQTTFFTLGDSFISSGFELYYSSVSNQVVLLYNNAGRTSTGQALTINTWYHIALVRNNNSTQIYINGIALGTPYSNSSTYSGILRIGVEYFNGAITASTVPFYIDDLRITNGVARYTATFTPPTASFADIQLIVSTNTNATFTTSTNIGSVTWGYNTATTRWGGIQEPTASVNLTPMSIQDQLNTSTGYFSLPTGTTQQRPVNPQGGYMRYNTTLDSVEYYNFITGWTTIP